MIISVSVSPRYRPLQHRQVTYIPRSLASRLAGKANIISVEYFENERPYFEADKTVLSLISHLGVTIRDDELRDFIEQVDFGPVYVHCEMGQMRSRHVAEQLVHHFGYSLVRSVVLPTENGPVDYSVY